MKVSYSPKQIHCSLDNLSNQNLCNAAPRIIDYTNIFTNKEMGDGEGIMSFTHFESTFFYWSEPLQSAQRIKESKKKNQRIVYLQNT